MTSTPNQKAVILTNMNIQPPVVEEPSELPAKSKKSKQLAFFAALLVFGLGIFIGRYLIPAGELKAFDALQFVSVEQGQRQLVFPTFWEAWDKLHANFIGDVDDKKLYYGAVAGMVRSAGDPYTVFAPPADTKQFEETIEGSFGGVGVEIGVKNGAVVVISPLDGSPAKKAGILEGDLILSVDKKPLSAETTLDEVVQSIRGENGQPVEITVLHEGETEPKDITVTRDTIAIESVRLDVIDNIAYVSIKNFNSDTAKRFNDIARQIKSDQVKGIILDVRGNPGGFLQSAVDIASRFIPKGQVVVAEKGHKDKDYNASGNTILSGIPTVILVNGGSASASEILAGALNDQLSTPVIGTQTFGKGSVQEFIKLSDGSSLRVTIAKWYTPKGRSINEEGITPSIPVELDRSTEADEQLNRALEEIKKLAQ
ncbi:MAG: Carboxyl-terminal protease [Parcubacteria group bacterium GW2011_GWA2_45_14]|nr:MAG: Carboxyl-terminal protease [Parcubacteria group bacterium GW2011_GWA2_45_14]